MAEWLAAIALFLLLLAYIHEARRMPVQLPPEDDERPGPDELPPPPPGWPDSHQMP